jgi:hypothetical protein
MASRTKGSALDIGIGQAVGKVHHALGVRAVPQPIEVSQLVHRFLQGPIEQEFAIGGSPIPFGAEAGQGYHRHPLGRGCHPEDEIETGRIQVYIGYAQDLVGSLSRTAL